MSSIDRRIVDMQFDNKDFKKNALDTVKTLDDLKEALNFDGAAGALTEVENAASNFSFRGMVDSVKDAISNFPVLGAIGLSAINKLTSAAMSFGANFINNVISPIKEGGWKRAMNLEQARFQLEGLKIAWDDIKPAILGAVQGTAYGLDEAAKAASQLAASQVPMENMEYSLRAIAGVAAMTSSGYSDIADVFTKVAGQGRVMADDLNRLSARGLNAAATLAEYFNTTETEIRQMVTQGKVSFEMFAEAMDAAFGEHATKANETYTGSLSNMRAALARIGEMPAATQMEKNRRIFNALTPAIDTVKNALTPLFDLMDWRAMRSARSMVNAITAINERFGPDLIGGMEAFTRGLRNVYEFFDRIGQTALEAWRSVFPSNDSGPTTFFTSLGEGFEKLTGYLKDTDGLLSGIGAVLRTVFSGLKTALDFLGMVGSVIGEGFSFAAEKAQQLWTAIQPVVDEVKAFISGIDFGGSGGGIPTIDNLKQALIDLKNLALIPINAIFEYLTPAFQAFSDAAGTGSNRIKAFFGAFSGLGEDIQEAFRDFNLLDSAFVNFFKKIGSGFASLWNVVKGPLGELGNFLGEFLGGIGDSLVNLTSGDLLAAVNTGVMAAFIVNIISILKSFKDILNDFSGIGESVTGVLTSVSTALEGLTRDESLATKIIKIALAIGILAGSFYLLSQTDVNKIGPALGAVVGLMAALTAMMFGLGKIQTMGDSIEFGAIATGMILAAGAVLVLTSALKKVAEIDEDALTRSVVAITVVMGALTAMMGLMTLISNTMKPGTVILAAGAMVIMAGALYVVAGAVAIFGNMPLDVLEQGAISAGIAIGALVAAGILTSQAAPKMLQGAIGMMAMAAALNMLLIPLAALGLMPLDILIQGMLSAVILLGGMAVAGVAMGKVGPQMALGALGMMAMAMAIQMMVPSIVALGMLDMDMLVQGLLGMAVALGVLVLAANAMSGAIVGAGAMILMAGAVVVLSVAINMLASIPFGQLIQGLIGAAAALAILVAAGYLATGAAVGLVALGIAALGLGAGMLMLSAGLVLFGPAAAIAATGLLLLANAAAEAGPQILLLIAAGLGLAVLGAGLAIVAAAAIVLGVALMSMGVGITMLAAAAIPGADAILYLVDQLTSISLLDMGKLALVTVALTALGAGLVVLGAGSLAASVGILAFAVAWAVVSVSVIATATPVIDAMNRLSAQLPPAMTALVNSAASAAASIPGNLAKVRDSFLQVGRGAIQAVNSASSAMQSAGQQLGMRLVQGITATLPAVTAAGKLYTSALATAIKGGTSQVTSSAKALVQGFVKEISNGSRLVAPPARLMVTTYVTALRDAAPRARAAGESMTAAAVRGMAAGSRGAAGAMRTAGYTIGLALSQGMRSGVYAGAASVRAAAYSVAQQAAQSARRALQIASPSKVMATVGKWFDLGMAKGITDNVGVIDNAATMAGESSIQHLKDAINEIGAGVMDELDLDPTIRPIMDLSDIEEKSASISRMLEPALAGGVSERASSVAGGSFGSTETAPVSKVTKVEFKQTNTSPKALPPSDIYRRTKNSLSVLREELEKL